MWISGSMINFFYIRAMKVYLNDSSDNLKIVGKLPLIGASAVTVFLFLYLFLDINLILDSQKPFKHYENLYMQAIGGFNAPEYLGMMGMLSTFSLIYSSVYFLKLIFKSKKSQKLLVAGIIMDFVFLLNDLAPVVSDFIYVVPLMFISNVFEITRLSHEVQANLKRKLNQLSNDLIETRKFSEVGHFYASLSHEILNPLFAAKGYFEMFLKNIPNEEVKNNHYANLIQKQHSKIETLALGIRKYTKISSDEFTAIDLRVVIQDAIDTLALKAGSHGISIELRGISVILACKKDQIVQVVTNVLNNSIEAISDLDEKWILIEYGLDETDHVFITITDSGNGITKEISDKIWSQRFTTKGSGAGLGLGICADIIRLHEGQIFLNDESKNTQFKIRLPRKISGP